MSLYINFEPHSWYRGFAIKDDRHDITEQQPWQAYGVNGMTGYIVTIGGGTLAECKQRITDWHSKENERIERLYKGVSNE